MISQDNSPHDPVVSILWILLDTLLNLLHSFGHFPFLEQSKSPMSMTIVIIRDVKLRLTTDVNSFWVELVQVEQESQVIVDKAMLRVDFNAFSPMFDGWVVEF